MGIALVPIVNLDIQGITTDNSIRIVFDLETLARIFSGNITVWNDPAIVDTISETGNEDLAATLQNTTIKVRLLLLMWVIVCYHYYAFFSLSHRCKLYAEKLLFFF